MISQTLSLMCIKDVITWSYKCLPVYKFTEPSLETQEAPSVGIVYRIYSLAYINDLRLKILENMVFFKMSWKPR